MSSVKASGEFMAKKWRSVESMKHPTGQNRKIKTYWTYRTEKTRNYSEMVLWEEQMNGNKSYSNSPWYNGGMEGVRQLPVTPVPGGLAHTSLMCVAFGAVGWEQRTWTSCPAASCASRYWNESSGRLHFSSKASGYHSYVWDSLSWAHVPRSIRAAGGDWIII